MTNNKIEGFFETSNPFLLESLIGLPLFANVASLYSIQRHWQTSVEIICLMRGSLKIELDSQKYQMTAGDIVVIDNNIAHRYWDGSPNNLCLQVTIGEKEIHRELDQLLWFSTIGEGKRKKTDWDVRVFRGHCAELCRLARELYQDAALSRTTLNVSAKTWYTLRLQLYSLLSMLTQSTIPQNDLVRRIPEEFVECLNYIHEHYTEPLVMEQVASATHYSSNTIFRFFQKHLGLSFNEYLTQLRIQVACRLLEQEKNSASYVAESVGLSVSQFYRAFQRLMGMPPITWQQKAKQGIAAYHMPNFEDDPVQNQYRSYPNGQIDWDQLLFPSF